MEVATKGFVLGAAEGETHWFLGSRMRRLAGSGDTEARFTLMEQTCPPRFAPPAHVHHDENEAFFVLDGSMEVTCGDDTWQVAAGDFICLPRGVWHGFRVSEQGVRILHLTAPGQFEGFVEEVGTLATGPGYRAPDDAELDRLQSALPRYGLEIGR